MRKKSLIIFILSFSLVLISCDGGPTSIADPVPTPTGTTAAFKISNGNIYYDTNCGGCHSLGSYDTDSAFGASDLTSIPITKIKSDMSDTVTAQYGGVHELMRRFNNVSIARVEELKKFISQYN